jgi:signal transduction histidine kinase
MVLKPMHAYAFAACLWVAVLVATIDSYLGLHLVAPTGIAVSTEQWVRVCVTSLIGIFALLYMFLRILGDLWRALEGQMDLRVREKRLVEEREKVLRAASSAQRLESLGRLAGGIAHDFNNSLVVIQCGLGALEDELTAAERAELLHELNDGVERAAGTARQLLGFAKRNVEELGFCDPGEVAKRLARDSARLLPAHIKLRVEVEPSPRVGLSATALEQLLLILLQNSREALQEDVGQVVVRIALDSDSAGASIEVRDNGPGMTQKVLEQAWEPFFTTRGEHKPGLGLSTVWGMVRRQGGDLLLESEVGKGTAVRVVLPAAVEPAEAPAPESLRFGAPSEILPVLVLEDEVGVRTALRRILKHSGYQVVEAGTVAEARGACEKARFALLISDGVLPDGGVGRFIQDFRESQNAPVILCSGYLEEDLALEGVARGQCSFLPKPFSAEDLTKLVAKLLAPPAS